jgi:hypothetical protein
MAFLRPLVRGALALALVLALPAPAALALPASTEQVPLELRPSQGPVGSDTIVHAAGWTANEDVHVYVDGRRAATEQADASGAAAAVVAMPESAGRHQVLLYGATSHRTAAGTFRVTPTGDARVAFLASPRPMRASGDADFPYAVRFIVANFPANTPIEGYYYWEPANDWFTFDVGTAEADGTYDDVWTWGATDFGVTSLAIGRPGATEPLLAVDALIEPKAGYSPQRRVRPVPALGRPDEPLFLVGSGFTPGAVTQRELTGPGTSSTVARTAAADGTVIARDATGDGDQEYRLEQGSAYGATAAYREDSIPTPPTAAAALDLLDPGTATTLVGVALTPGAVTLTGRDAAGVTTTTSATVAGDGTLQAPFTVPAGAAPGAYEIAVGEAYASLTVKGSLQPPSLRFGGGDIGVVALPPGGGDVTREREICNDGESAAAVSLTDDSPHVTVTPGSVNVPANACAAITVTVDDDGATGVAAATITAATASAAETVTFQRVLRSATIEPVTTRLMDANEPPHTPLHLSGTTEPNGQVRVIAVGYGDDPFDLGTANADGSGDWELQPSGMGPRGSHVRFVAVPSELPAGGDLSSYDPAGGVRYVTRWFRDMSTPTSVFRDVGEAGEGVGDVFVASPQTSTDSFDGAAALELASGGAAVGLTRRAEASEGGGLFHDDGLVVLDRYYDVGTTGVALKREHRAVDRTMELVDTFTNSGGTAKTFSVAVVTSDGREIDDQELRLSTQTEWLGDGEIPAGGATLLDDDAVPAEGYVAMRDEDAADAATSGHGFVAWRQAPERVLTRPGRRDLVVLEYEITVPANGTTVLRHAIGATHIDATALAAAAKAADTQVPVLTVTSPVQYATVGSRQVTVTGTVSDTFGTPSVEVATAAGATGVAATVEDDGDWSATITLPDGDGEKEIFATATDAQGHSTWIQRIVTLSRPPVVATGDARDLTQSSAVVDVSVDPNGNATTYAVEYGTSADALTSTTPTAGPVTGTSAATHAVSLGGLTPSTTYHYRVRADNVAGTRRGDVKTFTTATPPPDAATPSALTGSDRAATSITLSGSVDPNGSATTWWVEYGTSTTPYPSKTDESASIGSGTSAVPVTAPLTGLAPGTTYHARLVAKNAAGTTHGPDMTFTTKPTASSLTATELSAHTVRLTGTAAGAATWRIDYGTTTAYDRSKTGDGSTVNVVLDKLAANTKHHARLVAIRGTDEVAGPDVEFTTPIAPQPVASALTVGPKTSTTTALSGTVDPNGLPTTWRIEYGTTEHDFSLATDSVSAGDGTEPVAAAATLTGLSASTTYWARLAATNASQTSYGTPVQFTTEAAPPPAPDPEASKLTASEITATSAKLSGTVNPHGAGRWRIDHRVGDVVLLGEWHDVTGEQDVELTLTTLKPSMTYEAWLVVERGGHQEMGESVRFTTAAAPKEDDGGDGGNGGNSGGGGGGDGGSGGDPAPPQPGPVDPAPPVDPGPKACLRQAGAGCGAPPTFGPPTPLPLLPSDVRPKSVAAKGLFLRFDLSTADCTPACTVEASLLLPRALARKLRAAAAQPLVVVGSGRKTFDQGGVVGFRVKLKPKARRALAKARRVTLVVRTTLVDAQGSRAAAERRVTLKR